MGKEERRGQGGRKGGKGNVRPPIHISGYASAYVINYLIHYKLLVGSKRSAVKLYCDILAAHFYVFFSFKLDCMVVMT